MSRGCDGSVIPSPNVADEFARPSANDVSPGKDWFCFDILQATKDTPTCVANAVFGAKHSGDALPRDSILDLSEGAFAKAPTRLSPILSQWLTSVNGASETDATTRCELHEDLALVVLRENSGNLRISAPDYVAYRAFQRDSSWPMDLSDEHFTDSRDIADLLRRARRGDDEALGQLLDRFRPLLEQRAAESLHGPIKARIDQSDIVQQTCLSAVRQFDQFHGEQTGQFLAWLLQIQRHNVLNTIRYHRGARRRTIDRELSGDGPMADAEGHLTSPTGKAVREERRRAIEDALAALPDNQAAAIRLRYLEHASLAEIAARLNRSEDACAGLLKRGMALLRQRLRRNDIP